MKRVSLRNILSTAAVLGTTIATTAALAQPSQGGNGPGYGMGPGMMDGYGAGWMGGYGGIWVPILVVVAVAGLVAWIVRQKRK